MVIQNQYSKNAKVSIVSTIILHMLMDNEDFKKTFREKYVHLYFEMEGF